MVQGPQGSNIHVFKAHVSKVTTSHQSIFRSKQINALSKPNALCAKTSKGNSITRYKTSQPQVDLRRIYDNPNPPNKLHRGYHRIRVIPKVPQRGMTQWAWEKFLSRAQLLVVYWSMFWNLGEKWRDLPFPPLKLWENLKSCAWTCCPRSWIGLCKASLATHPKVDKPITHEQFHMCNTSVILESACL